MSEIPILLADSITHVPGDSSPARVVICGSHGGWAAGVFALKKGLHGVIFNDAGGGKEDAGIAALPLLESHGIYCAAVDVFSARIGIARETEGGRISFANGPARDAGVRPGMAAREAARLFQEAPALAGSGPGPSPGEYEEQSTVIHASPAGYRIVALDSNSQVTPENRLDIILTGSHGGLVGAAPAVKHPVAAAFYNDAKVGKERAGITRLPWLQQAGIVAAAVDADTARIGVGMETYLHGIVSHANGLALAMGIGPGTRARDAAWRILEEKEKGAPFNRG